MLVSSALSASADTHEAIEAASRESSSGVSSPSFISPFYYLHGQNVLVVDFTIKDIAKGVKVVFLGKEQESFVNLL